MRTPAPSDTRLKNAFDPLDPSPLLLSPTDRQRSRAPSLANYTAETGFAPATHDVFIEAPMSAVDRANLDLVLPQIAAMQTFVRALADRVEMALGLGGALRVSWGCRTACGLSRPGTERARATVHASPDARPGSGCAAPLPTRSAASAVLAACVTRAARAAEPPAG
jgi:hypothetical protein